MYYFIQVVFSEYALPIPCIIDGPAKSVDFDNRRLKSEIGVFRRRRSETDMPVGSIQAVYSVHVRLLSGGSGA